MDQAVYDPVSDKIYGVRSQWVYRFSNIGALESSLRFYSGGRGIAWVCMFGGNVCCSIRNFDLVDWDNISPDGDIFIVPTSLASSTPMWLYNTLTNRKATGFGGDYDQAWATLTTISGRIHGKNRSGSGGFSLTSSGDIITGGFTSFAEDITYDSVNDLVWVADSGTPDWTVYHPSDLNNFAFGFPETIRPRGVAYVPTVDSCYAVQGNSVLLVASGAAAAAGIGGTEHFPWSTIALPGGINPVRIKYCPYASPHPFAGKLLIPTWKGDSVLVFNPTTNTMTATKTGFTAPFDIAFTPNPSPTVAGKAFAVQNSSQGLKEVSA